MRILVTGGSGLVGSNLVATLGNKHHVMAPRHHELDLLNKDAVRAYLVEKKPDLVIHCAGIVGGIQANIANPVKFLNENTEMGLNVVMGSFEAGITNLINMGSSCMYPRNAHNPLTEETVLQGELEPTNEGYAIAKIVSQRLCAYINRQNIGFRYKTLIPCNLYGINDKFDPVHSHMIPAVIRKIHEAKVSGSPSVSIWGSGKAKREFMFAGDLADFVAEFLDRLEDLPDLVNVGLGHDYTIDQYYQAIADVIGYQGKFEHDLTKPEGMSQKLVNVEKVRALGWTAKTSLEQGIRETYQYFLSLGDR